MKTYTLFSVIVILAILNAALPVIGVEAAGTISVMPTDVGVNWFTNDTRPGGSSAFVVGPGSPPLGVGSLQFATTDTMGGSSQAKAQLFNYQFGSLGVPGDGVSLADIDEMSYWSYRASSSTNPAAQTISLNMEVDNIGDGTGYTTLVFEPIYNPSQGAMALDTWQNWDAFDSGNAVWWSTMDILGVCAFNCFVPWSTILANNPDAEIIYAFGFNVGSGWVGNFEGYADTLTFGVAGDSTTYDFEPVIQCTSVCYANVNTGNDANGGSNPSDAKKTIQAAIDQVDSGGTVIVAAGMYNENLNIAKPLSIQGEGSGTNPSVDTIIDASGGSIGIHMHRSVNLSDLRVTGASLDGIRVYRLASDTRLNFENATWQNIASVTNGAKGVEIHNDTDVSNLTIANSEFIGNAGQGLRTASNDTVDGLTITDSLFNQNSYGIFLQGVVNGLTILRSSFNDSVGGYGGYMTEAGSLTNMAIEDSEFNNNVVGLMVWNTDDNSDLSISETVFQNNDKWGALIWGNTLTNVLIQNSDVLNNDGLGAGYYDIDFYTYADAMENVAVHYNNITGHSVGGGLKNRNEVDSAQVDATCNWWGAGDGPSGSGMGSGDAVTDYVTFIPWLISAAPDGPCTGMPDTEGPITTNVAVDPNPAAVGTSITVTANVDDTTTGDSNIASAEYSLDNGPWTAMSASDGVFDEISENVIADFVTPSEPGIYDLCVRGTDELGNVGEPECIMSVVYDPSGGFVTGGGWIDSPAGAYYPSDLPYYDGSYYEIVQLEPALTFAEVREAAEAMMYSTCKSAHLATITSQGEYDAVLGLFDTWQDATLGGYQDEDALVANEGWQWVTDEPFDFEIQRDWWYPGEPNDCGNDFCPPGSEQVLVMEHRGDMLGWNDIGSYDALWIGYPMIEYENCETNPTGKATFGFVSKYKKGASVPEGSTEFQFKAGNLNFHSTSYDWLVVTGSDYAKFKGTGTINGEGEYKFMIWAGDDDPDTFRIKIWYENGGNEVIVYDNGMDQEIGGGSIVVHKAK